MNLVGTGVIGLQRKKVETTRALAAKVCKARHDCWDAGHLIVKPSYIPYRFKVLFQRPSLWILLTKDRRCCRIKSRIWKGLYRAFEIPVTCYILLHHLALLGRRKNARSRQSRARDVVRRQGSITGSLCFWARLNFRWSKTCGSSSHNKTTAL